MAGFFINRPILAWVIAIVIMMVGAASVRTLPVEQYPSVAPVSVQITATYPGASAETVATTVTQVIEQKLSGIDNLLYMSSTSSNAGTATITLTFQQGTNADIAQVQVQNKVQQATSSLPQTVQNQGVQVAKAANAFLMIVSLSSSDGSMNSIDLGNVIATQIEDPLTQIDGVGDVTLFGAQHAMRVWLDPVKLQAVGLTASDVTTAITNQNVQLSVGQIGGSPSTKVQAINATISASSLLTTPAQFGSILLRVNTDGSKVLLSDVARVEVGGDDYSTDSRLNGKPAASLAVKLASGANAMSVAKAVRAKLDQLTPQLPQSVVVDYPYDTTPFVRISIEEVVKTLIEAVMLVFVVMYVFLQNLRATLIPTIVVPVALLGTFAVMSLVGFSINVLSMFGLVLAIGLLVDDAIVVVENVERLIAEEKLSPLEATRKAMKQITGALVGITTVLIAVFIPMAFFSGSTGAIYRQFSITIVAAMLLSVFLALTLTPALCATLLRRSDVEHHEKRGLLGWFNRVLARGTDRYSTGVSRVVGKPARYLVIYALIAGVVVLLFTKLPSSYLPEEDQGIIITSISTPVGTPSAKTLETVKQVEAYYLGLPQVDKIITLTGFSFNGSGQNNALAFVKLKDWSTRRGKDGQASSIILHANMHFATAARDAQIFALNPPAIQELGTQSGLDFELEDRAGQGHDKLMAARRELMALAANNSMLSGMRPGGLDDTPQFHVDIDREKASALGLSVADVNDTLQTAFGSTYVNNYVDTGRIQKVYVQADAPYRMMPADIGRWYVRSSTSTSTSTSSTSSTSSSSTTTSTTSYDGQMVPFSAFSSGKWSFGPPQIERFNRTLAMEITAQTGANASTGQAMDAVEALVKKLPAGFGIDWTGQSYQERLAGSQAIYLYAISVIVVFLCLAGLYESWSIPIAVILVVPLGVLGALLGAQLRGLPDDIYFKVGLLATIGLSTKNAILIVEFAKDLQAQGRSLIDATLEAARLRLRPILMTSLAFVFGVLPLVISTGAGSASRHAIGTGVMGGMIAATVLAIFFVPVFFVVVRRLFGEHGHTTQNEGEQ